jgi:hypothetical protein
MRANRRLSLSPAPSHGVLLLQTLFLPVSPRMRSSGQFEVSGPPSRCLWTASAGVSLWHRSPASARTASNQQVVVGTQPHQHTCQGCRLLLGETEDLRIEPPDIVQKPAAARYRPAGHTRFGVVLSNVPPLGGISVTRSSPHSNDCRSYLGESMPPDSRQAIPVTATGTTCVSATRVYLIPSLCYRASDRIRSGKLFPLRGSSADRSSERPTKINVDS